MVKNTKLYLKFTSLALCFVVEKNPKIKNQESLFPPQEGPGTHEQDCQSKHGCMAISRARTAMEIHMQRVQMHKTVITDLCVERWIHVHVSFVHRCVCTRVDLLVEARQ